MKNERHKKLHYRKGVTLIEALFVLGIAAILLGLVMVLVSNSSQKSKNNQCIAEIATIADTVHSLCDSSSNCIENVDITGPVAQSGLLSQKYVKADKSSPIDPYGMPIDDIHLSYDQGNNLYLVMHVYTVNKQECIQYGEYLQQSPAWAVYSYSSLNEFISYCNNLTYSNNGAMIQVYMVY